MIKGSTGIRCPRCGHYEYIDTWQQKCLLCEVVKSMLGHYAPPINETNRKQQMPCQTSQD